MEASRKVDRTFVATGVAFVADYESPVKAVQAAYNTAAQTAGNFNRTPVMVEVYVRVAPEGAT